MSGEKHAGTRSGRFEQCYASLIAAGAAPTESESILVTNMLAKDYKQLYAFRPEPCQGS
jgi:hypothetical protein